MMEYSVEYSNFSYPQYFRNLQDAIKNGAEYKSGDAFLYRNEDLIADWKNGKLYLYDTRKNTQKAFDRYLLNSALTIEQVNKKIAEVANYHRVEVEEDSFFKERGLLRVKHDLNNVATVDIKQNYETAKKIGDWTVYEIIINPHICSMAYESTPQKLYQAIKQIKQMADFAESLIFQNFKLKSKDD